MMRVTVESALPYAAEVCAWLRLHAIEPQNFREADVDVLALTITVRLFIRDGRDQIVLRNHEVAYETINVPLQLLPAKEWCEAQPC